MSDALSPTANLKKNLTIVSLHALEYSLLTTNWERLVPLKHIVRTGTEAENTGQFCSNCMRDVNVNARLAL